MKNQWKWLPICWRKATAENVSFDYVILYDWNLNMSPTYNTLFNYPGRRNNWCFLCVFEQHVERASQSSQAFSPLNILALVVILAMENRKMLMNLWGLLPSIFFNGIWNGKENECRFFLLSKGDLLIDKDHIFGPFSRIVVDTMQSVCLDEFGGEKALSPASQETTLIQHIFGGQLQSQVLKYLQYAF